LKDENQSIIKWLPLVSIVTPVSNGEEWVEKCIKSVSTQDYPCIEHIIVGRSFTDETLEFCAGFPNVVLCSSNDMGQVHAINTGFSMAKGDILAWLCPNDQYEPGAISAVVKELLRGHLLVMGRSRFINERDEILFDHPASKYSEYSHEMLLRFWRFPTISQPTVFWRRSLWESSGPLREDLSVASDYDLWLKMSAITKIKMISAYITTCRITSQTEVSQANYAASKEMIKVSIKFWPGWWRITFWRLLISYFLNRHSFGRHHLEG